MKNYVVTLINLKIYNKNMKNYVFVDAYTNKTQVNTVNNYIYNTENFGAFG